ncbi:TetR/AcrR family transcriptional regulator [Streptomyces olivochromogenes]|uniref:TetR/AcrR family transcriptional regulator n=1 Tax=Streptomyces olivochromogenes TaxID=1963 RepID=UPI001F485995|nr:TetR/AcrR family transcriptional regulator [Streptomyces olivochromogenes]MCF3131218.1 TetR family transcriptional regulator [Streptomyces olivochromogenes]
MGRWEPNARGRLAQAALTLYAEQGFEKTTAAEIAARAGLTERTFFRHFADKREVLFAGTEMAHDLLARTVAEAPPGTPPVDVVTSALEAFAAVLQENPERVRLREAIVSANPDLRERELTKLAALVTTMADALRARGVPDLTASLTAETGIAVFKVAYAHWTTTASPSDLRATLRDSLRHLRTALAAQAPA